MTRRLKTYPALGSVDMPRSAEILAVYGHEKSDFPPSLLVSYDDNDVEKITRRFVALRSLDVVPDGARFLASWRVHPVDGGLIAVFERVGSDDLTFMHDCGFTLRKADKAWIAPDSEPLTTELFLAVARLQEQGYGPVVSA